MVDNHKGEKMGQVIQIDETRIHDHLGEIFRGTVEKAVNALPDAEAGRPVMTGHCIRRPVR